MACKKWILNWERQKVLEANGHHATINFVYKLFTYHPDYATGYFFLGGGDGSKVQKARAVDIE